MPKITEFLEGLKLYGGADVYNPCRDYDGVFDVGVHAVNQRLINLEAYLRERLGRARYILVAEALGYQGGHFTGLAMTSERIILNKQKGLSVNLVFSIAGCRTSNQNNPQIKKTQKLKGFAEPTATTVWNSIISSPVSPFEVVLWNIFPFHPYRNKVGVLSNRPPRKYELDKGIEYICKIKELFPEAKLLSIGKKS